MQNLYNFTPEQQKIFTSIDYLQRNTEEKVSQPKMRLDKL
jgi:hypothetical protein